MNQEMKGGVFYFSHSLMTIYLSYFNYFFFFQIEKKNSEHIFRARLTV